MTILNPTENNSQLIFILKYSNLLLTPGLSLIQLSQNFKKLVVLFCKGRRKIVK